MYVIEKKCVESVNVSCSQRREGLEGRSVRLVGPGRSVWREGFGRRGVKRSGGPRDGFPQPGRTPHP
jgi:hypothetical protein